MRCCHGNHCNCFQFSCSCCRHYAIVQAMKYARHVTSPRILMTLIGILVWSIIIALPPLFTTTDFQYNSADMMCSVSWSSSLAYSSVLVAVNLALPIIVITCCYVHICYVAQKKCKKVYIGWHDKLIARRKSSWMPGFHQRSPSLKSNCCTTYKAIFTTAIVTGGFMITWVPYTICVIMQMTEANLPCWFRITVTYLAFASAVVNPLIYAVYNRTIRKQMLIVICKKTQRDDSELAIRKDRPSIVSILDFFPASYYKNNLSFVEHSGMRTNNRQSNHNSPDSGKYVNGNYLASNFLLFLNSSDIPFLPVVTTEFLCKLNKC